MTILLTFDETYARHASVVMESIIRNCSQKLKFAVLYSNIKTGTIDKLKRHYASRVLSLDFIKIEKGEFSRFKNTKTIEHIPNPEVVLLRLFCERVNEEDFLLYLDCDLIVVDDVLKILDYTDDHKILAAVNEYSNQYKYSITPDLPDIMRLKNDIDPWIYEAFWYRTFEDLGMNHGGKYFNAGVMLINMKLWREKNIGQKCLDYLERNPELCIATDQDALNHVINGDYTELPPQWNPNTAVCMGIFTNYSLVQLEEAKINPVLYHTNGEVKPWHEECEYRIRNLYIEYRKKTPWPDFTIKSITVNINRLVLIKRKIKRVVGMILGRRLKQIAVNNIHYKDVYYYRNNNRYFIEGRIK